MDETPIMNQEKQLSKKPIKIHDIQQSYNFEGQIHFISSVSQPNIQAQVDQSKDFQNLASTTVSTRLTSGFTNRRIFYNSISKKKMFHESSEATNSEKFTRICQKQIFLHFLLNYYDSPELKKIKCKIKR